MFYSVPQAPPEKVPDHVGGGGGSVGTLKITWTVRKHFYHFSSFELSKTRVRLLARYIQPLQRDDPKRTSWDSLVAVTKLETVDMQMTQCCQQTQKGTSTEDSERK